MLHQVHDWQALLVLALFLLRLSSMKPISKHAIRTLLSVIVGVSSVGLSSSTMAVPDFSHGKHADELGASIGYKKALDGISGGCSDEAQAGRENPHRNASQHVNTSCFSHKLTDDYLELANGSDSEHVAAVASHLASTLLQSGDVVVQASVVTPAQDEPLPQPGTLVLLGLSLAGLGWSCRRK